MLVLLPLLVLSVSSVQRLHKPTGQSKEPPPQQAKAENHPEKAKAEHPQRTKAQNSAPKVGWAERKNIYASVE